jgi:RNA polymerase sigma factor FliA
MLHTNIEHDTLTYARQTKVLGTKDPEMIVREHSAMVRRIAWHVHARMSTAIEIEDLIQIGLFALIEAARCFQERGVAFAPYAATRVRGAMIDALRRDARMARAGMAKRREIAQVRARLENQLLRPASDTEMADAMGLTPHAFHAAVTTTQAVRQDSLDAVYSDHDAWFADGGLSADAQMEEQEARDALAGAISGLPEREAMILQLYFVEELNLDEIGLTLGIGAARVCQIKKQALGRLRAALAEEALPLS